MRNVPSTRPEIGPETPIYGPLIWLIVLLPLISAVIQLFWNPAPRVRYVGSQHLPMVDPGSLLTPTYFVLIFANLAIYAGLVVLAYFDWARLGRSGVVRPFPWAWTFLSAIVYVVGRSVIVHKVAPHRGLAPIWVLIGVYVISYVTLVVKLAQFYAQMASFIQMTGR